ncbi:MAG: hypothetical protein Q9167_006498, partial [Letrouitia subvulpina]
LCESNDTPKAYTTYVNYHTPGCPVTTHILAPLGSGWVTAFGAFEKFFKVKTSIEWDRRLLERGKMEEGKFWYLPPAEGDACRITIPVWQLELDLSSLLLLSAPASPHSLICLGHPQIPLRTHRSNFPISHPTRCPRHSNRLPQRRREILIFLPTLDLHPPHDIVAQIPVPLRRQRRHHPIRRVEDDVAGREPDLQLELGVAQADDAEHEHERAEQGDDAVRPGGDGVLALLRVPVQLTRDVLLAAHDEEGAVGVLDDDVRGRNGPRGGTLLQAELPAVGEANEGREEREEEGGEQGEAVAAGDREGEQGYREGGAEDGEEGEPAAGASVDFGRGGSGRGLSRSRGCGGHLVVVVVGVRAVHHDGVAALGQGGGLFDLGRILDDFLAADGVRAEAVAIVDEVGNIIDVVANAA